MPTLELSVEQVIALVQQLPPAEQRAVSSALQTARETWWRDMATQGESQMRRLCAERGLDWDALSEDERERFIDDVLHEDQ